MYKKCLRDEDHRIRELALKRLDEEGGDGVQELRKEIEALLNDPDMEVKRAALKVLKNGKTWVAGVKNE